MEPSGRNRGQPVANGTPRKPLKHADPQPVATHGNGFGAHGKEGVDGSSPSEGFDTSPANRPYCVACFGASCVRGYETGTHSRDWRASAGKRDVGCRLATHLVGELKLRARENLPAYGHTPLPCWASPLTPSLQGGGQHVLRRGVVGRLARRASEAAGLVGKANAPRQSKLRVLTPRRVLRLSRRASMPGSNARCRRCHTSSSVAAPCGDSRACLRKSMGCRHRRSTRSGW
jgi:hypothetical protein